MKKLEPKVYICKACGKEIIRKKSPGRYGTVQYHKDCWKELAKKQSWEFRNKGKL
jgi:hypothetical protein